MTITKATNGWILQLPKEDDSLSAIKSMMPGMAKAIHKITDDDMLHTTESDAPINFWPEPIGLMALDTYVFLTFQDMMAFMKIAFENFEGIDMSLAANK